MVRQIKLHENIWWIDMKMDLVNMLDCVNNKEQLEQFLTSMYTLLRNYDILSTNQKDI